jgi:hypothetical protein
VVLFWHVPATRAARQALINGVILLAAGLHWFALFREHALVHRSVIVELMPGLALLLGGLTGIALTPWNAGRSWRAPARWLGPPLALALLGGFVYQIRTSNALNQIVRLQPQVRESVLSDRQAWELLARSAPRLRRFNRIHMENWHWLAVAYLTDVNVRFTLAAPSVLEPGEVFLVNDYWLTSDSDSGQALRRFGVPDVFSSPLGWAAFGPDCCCGQAVDIGFGGVLRITSLRWGSSLDDESRVLMMSGKISPDACDGCVIVCEVLAPDGASHAVNETRPRWCLCRDGEFAAWYALPVESLPPVFRLQLRVWNIPGARWLPIEADAMKLPAGGALLAGGAGFVWDTSASPTQIAFGNRLRITDLHWRATVEGDSSDLIIRGCVNAAMADRLILECELVEPTGEGVSLHEARPAWGQCAGGAFGVRVAIPVADADAGVRLHCRVWSIPDQMFVPIAVDDTRLPYGVELLPDAAGFACSPAALPEPDPRDPLLRGGPTAPGTGTDK